MKFEASGNLAQDCSTSRIVVVKAIGLEKAGLACLGVSFVPFFSVFDVDVKDSGICFFVLVL